MNHPLWNHHVESAPALTTVAPITSVILNHRTTMPILLLLVPLVAMALNALRVQRESLPSQRKRLERKSL